VKKIIYAALVIFIFTVFIVSCSGGPSSEDALPKETAAQVIKDKIGDPHYIYINFSALDPKKKLGQELKKLIDTGVYEYEWGDVRKVYVPKKEEAAQYAQGDISINLSGQISGDLAVQKVFLDNILKIKIKKHEAIVTYIERYEPSTLYNIIMEDPEAKVVVEEARKAGEIPAPKEKQIILVKENETWRVK